MASSCLACARSTSNSPGHRRPRLSAQARSILSRIWGTSRSSPSASAINPSSPSSMPACLPKSAIRSGCWCGPTACMSSTLGLGGHSRRDAVVVGGDQGAGMATVRLRGVSKRFGRTEAVENLHLTVEDGEFFVLLGPSGAGKTTTLGLIAGLETLDNGEIYLDDDDVTKLNPWKRDVAMAFESYALYPHMSVFDNIAFPLRAPTRSPRLSEQAIKTEVHRIATMLQIEKLLDRSPSQLSGGQRQRTSLGRMLVRRPRAFLMDEPIVHLDAKLRHHMRGELKLLHEQFAITTLYATPDWVEAVAMGHRIAVLNQGRIVQIGTPDEIYNYPVNRFVADFVGEPPMNILEGQFIRQDGLLQFDLGGAAIAVNDRLGHALEGADGTEWQLGVRPSGVILEPTQTKQLDIPATVFVSEPLGRDTILETRLAGQALTVKVPGLVSFESGTPVWLSIDSVQLHAFDKRTGSAVRFAPISSAHDGGKQRTVNHRGWAVGDGFPAA